MKQADELLSALLDGECSGPELDRLLDDIQAYPELKARWSRYCFAKAVIQGQASSEPLPDFAEKIMAALDSVPEPRATVDLSARKVSFFPRRSGARRGWRSWAGFAAAASVAGMVTVSIGHHEVPATTSAAAASTVAVVQTANVTSTNASTAGQPAMIPVAFKETRWSQLDTDSAHQLDDLVIEHSNYRAIEGVGADLSFARVAAHGIENHPEDGSH